MVTTTEDPEADAMFVRLRDAVHAVRTEEVAPGILLDYDAAGQVIGIEVLNVHARMKTPELVHP